MKHVAILRKVSLTAAFLLASSVPLVTGATPAASADVPEGAVGNLTNELELTAIRALADARTEPHAGNREKIEAAAGERWKNGDLNGQYKSVGEGQKYCLANAPAGQPPKDTKQPLVEAAPDIYAKVLAYHLTKKRKYAKEARDHLLELASSEGFDRDNGPSLSGGNECVLKLSESIPVYIESALLLEGSDAWTDGHRAKFGGWLRDTVYQYTAWASRDRKNNWGAAGSAASWAIAHYLSTSDKPLREKVLPDQLTPEQAMVDHEDMALKRMGRKWKGSSTCASRGKKHGIQRTGGIPDELRRGHDGKCKLDFLRETDKSYKYHTMHTTLLILHAEMLRRHGSNSIFEFETAEGDNAIELAILFVIANQHKSHPWQNHRRGALFIAHNALGNTLICDEAKRASDNVRLGATLPYARLTHPFSCGDGAS